MKTIVTYHGVISQKQIDKEFNKINQIKLPVFLTKLLFKIIFSTSKKYIDTVIVHEEYFKNILIKEYGFNRKKIDVIFHGVENLKIKLVKKDARKQLKLPQDKKIIWFFGFLAGYKGIELLIQAFNKLSADEYILIIAGGKPSRVKNDKKYIQWYNRVEKMIGASGNIIRKDFVPDKDIYLYYTATDLLILPYAVMLSASGPMSFAIGYEKPFIASDVFKEVLPDKFIFQRNEKALSEKIEEFFHNQEIFQKEISEMKNNRLWTRVGQQTFNIYKNNL